MSETTITHPTAEVPPIHPQVIHAAEIPMTILPTPEPHPESMVDTATRGLPAVEFVEATPPSAAIPEEKIRSFHEHDADILDQLNGMRHLMTQSLARANGEAVSIKKDSAVAIEVTKLAHAEQQGQFDQAKDDIIASTLEQYAVGTSQLRDLSNGYIAEHDRITTTADELQSVREAISDYIRELYSDINSELLDHRTQRDTAIGTINALDKSYTSLNEKLTLLADALEQAVADRERLEEIKEALIAKSADLTFQEQELWRPSMEQYRFYFRTNSDYQYADESDEMKQALADMKRKLGPKMATNPDWIALQGKKAALDEEREQNTRFYGQKSTDISGLKMEIRSLTQTIETIPGKLREAEATLQDETEQHALIIQQKTADVVYIAKAYEAINNGDLELVAGMILPDVLRPLYDKKLANIAAINAVSDNPVPSWQRPQFQIDEGKRLQLSPGSPNAIYEGVQRARTRQVGAEAISTVQRVTSLSPLKRVKGAFTAKRNHTEYAKEQ